jgi:ribonucleoside-diphosphate reductase alpha chain
MAVSHDTIIISDAGIAPASSDRISDLWSAGEKPVLRITSKYGLQLLATPDTEIETSEGWMYARALKPGTEIKVSPQVLSGNATHIEDLNIPWSRRLGRLIGLLTASGRLFTDIKNGLAVGFEYEDLQVAQEFQETCATLLNTPSWVVPYTSDNGKGHEMVRLRTTHSPEVSQLMGLCVRDRVNPRLWDAPREAVLGFLEGYACNNGTVDPSAGQLTLYFISTSERFAREFKLLLLSTTSVNAKIHVTNSERTPDRQRYRIRIEKSNLPMFLAQVQLLRHKMRETVEQSRQKNFRQDDYRDEIASVQPGPICDVYDIVTEGFTCSANGFRIR